MFLVLYNVAFTFTSRKIWNHFNGEREAREKAKHVIFHEV